MKMHLKAVISAGAVGIGLAMVNSARADGTVVVTSPGVVMSGPAVTATPVPDEYVWDGNEYVGVIGDQYYYLGPGDVWMPMDPDRLHRFNGWERDHADWRSHETHNVRYRNMRHDEHPRELRGNGPPDSRQYPEHKDHDHDHDHDRDQNSPPH